MPRLARELASPKYVPPESRIVTFDQDGTLWVEHPIYCQLVYCLDRVPAVVEQRPELKKVEPFKTVLSGDREAIARLPLKDLEEIAAVTLSGMTVEEFSADVKKWLTTAKQPRWKRSYTELTYLPMLEVRRRRESWQSDRKSPVAVTDGKVDVTGTRVTGSICCRARGFGGNADFDGRIARDAEIGAERTHRGHFR
jgi:hypothetical protein